jgi:VanZ family protein
MQVTTPGNPSGPWNFFPQPGMNKGMPHIENPLLRIPVVSAIRLAAAGAAVVVAVASLSPQSPAVASGLGDKLDHLAAYTVLTVLMALGWAGRISVGIIFAAVIGFGGLLELLQAFSPGRQPDWADFAVNTTGCLIGLAATVLIRRYGYQAPLSAVFSRTR